MAPKTKNIVFSVGADRPSCNTSNILVFECSEDFIHRISRNMNISVSEYNQILIIQRKNSLQKNIQSIAFSFAGVKKKINFFFVFSFYLFFNFRKRVYDSYSEISFNVLIKKRINALES